MRFGPGLVIVALAVVGALFVMGSRTLAVSLARPLVVADPIRQVDAIVVLGGGAYADGTLTPETAYRLLYAVQLFRRGHAPLLILSGGSHKETKISDAEAMATVAGTFGIDRTSMALDPVPSSTIAQATSAADLAPRYGVRTVALVTSPLRSRRAALAFRRAGLEVVSTPGLDHPAGLLVANDHLLRRLQMSLDALYEYTAVATYWWKGWI